MMAFDQNKRTPLSRTMFPLSSHEELSDDELKHYGRLGQKWGVRNPVGSNGLVTGYKGSYIGKPIYRTGLKIKKAARDYSRSQKAKAKTKADTNLMKKSPKDMDDDELKTYHSRITSQRKLEAASKNKSLDGVSRETAKKLLRESAGKSTAELKKEADRLTERSRQLNELRPSKNTKQGYGWKLVKLGLKTVSNTDAVMDIVIGTSQTKAITKDGVKKALTDGKSRKKGVLETNVRTQVSQAKNAKIDSIVDKVWAKRIDKKGGF